MKSSTKIIYAVTMLFAALCISQKSIAQSDITAKSETAANAKSLYPIQALVGSRIVMDRHSINGVTVTATYMGMPLRGIAIIFEPIGQTGFADETDTEGQLSVYFQPYSMFNEDVYVFARATSDTGQLFERVVGHVLFDKSGEIARVISADN